MTTMLPPVSTPQISDFDWDLPELVSDLRELREASLRARKHEGRPVKMPSRKALVAIVENLSIALFPNRLGSRELADEAIDFFVGQMLDTALRDLNEQIFREFQPISCVEAYAGPQREQAIQITRAFAKRLPRIRELLETDIRAAYDGDPAARSIDEVLVCYPGIVAITHYRLAHQLFDLGAPLVARMMTEIAHSTTGIDIHPGAKIQDSFFIDHGTGVVIGETVEIGPRVRLYQAVTLGAKRFPTDENGMLLKGNARHPIVENDVVIYAGATILGRITIGHHSCIGGNVWLTRSVPPHSQVSQAKVRTEDFEGGAGI